MQTLTALLTTLVIAIVSNVPLGCWRAGVRKFSWQWFVAVHLSVPLVVAVRMGFGVPLWDVPLLMAAAIGGQLLGTMIQHRVVSLENGE